jgi:probable HAF family extracellular repeat protein
MQSLGFLPGGEGLQSQAYGVSADGSVVVGYSRSVEGNQAFRWTKSGGLEGLGDLPGGLFGSFAFAVSADGSVAVGESWAASGGEAFRWTAEDGMVGLGDLPGGSFNSSARGVSADGSVIAGYGRTETAWQAFRWTQETGMVDLGDLPGGDTFSTVQDLSADGTAIVGWSGSYWSPYEAYLWTESGGWRGLGDFAGGDSYSEALGVSADGSVVVGYGTTASGQRAFIWDENNEMRYLKNVLENNYGLDLTGWTLNGAASISDDGLTIVGWGKNPQGASEAWIARLAELVGLEIVGPNEVAEHSIAGYQAIAYYDNNSTMDVTDLAQWSVEPNAIASISAGLLTTAEIGSQEEDITIYCQYVEAAAIITAEKPVRVVAVCLGTSALYFDGVDDCVATSLEIDQSGSSDVTMVAWVYPTATSPYRQQVISSDNGGFDWSLLKRHGTWRVFTGDRSWNSGFSVDINGWQHVAAVFKAGQDVISYKDGVSRSRGSAPDIDISDNPVAIGDNPARWDEHFEGKIDEVRVYNRALTAEEIWENMHRKLGGEEPNLIGYWDFDEGEGQFAYDLSRPGVG